MQPLKQNEVFKHLSGFLKNKGIELTQGSYSQGIQKSCSLLTDAINLGQRGFGKAKLEVDAKLDQMRQVIHKKTAPKSPARAPSSPVAATAAKATRKATKRKRPAPKPARRRARPS